MQVPERPNPPPEPAASPEPAGEAQTAMPDSEGEMVGEASFPASDPPAVWTWDPGDPPAT